jgi:hypothetical protein
MREPFRNLSLLGCWKSAEPRHDELGPEISETRRPCVHQPLAIVRELLLENTLYNADKTCKHNVCGANTKWAISVLMLVGCMATIRCVSIGAPLIYTKNEE